MSNKRDNDTVAPQEQRGMKRRSETGISPMAQGKGKQRSFEEDNLPSQSSSSSGNVIGRRRSSIGSRRSGRGSGGGAGEESSGSGGASRGVLTIPTSEQQEYSVSLRTISTAAPTSISLPLQSRTAAALPSSPPPPLTPQSPMSQTRYLLHILQQPSIGCAFGSNLLSRLAISPPLIVQLQAIDRAGKEVLIEHELPFLVCRVQLKDEDGNSIDMLTSTSSSTIPSPESLPSSSDASASTAAAPVSVRLLYGTLVASPMQLQSLDTNRPSVIFVFPEISIRSRGRFQLEVILTRLPLPSSLGPTTASAAASSSTIAIATTEPFNVVLSADYTAPEVTDLTRHFARQGVGLLLPPEQAQSGPTAD